MSIADDLTKLEQLRHNGALSDDEFARAKAALLSGSPAGADPQLGQHLADQLAEVKHQNELAQIDREWAMEREQFMVMTQYGRKMIPTPGIGIGMALIGGVFGALWTIVALSITGNAPDEGPFPIFKMIFPAFGVIFTIGAIAMGLYVYSRALKYQQAFAAYKARRRQSRPDDFE
jgi:hypothetical protein